MTTAAYSLDSLVDRATASSRGIGYLHRLLELREDDRFAEQKLATNMTRYSEAELLIRQIHSLLPGGTGPMSVRDTIDQFSYRDVHSASVMTSIAVIVGVDRGAVSRTTWRWIAAMVVVSVVTSEATGQHRDVAATAPLMAHLGYLMLAAHAPGLVAEVDALAEERGITRADAEQTLTGFTEFDLADRVVASWDIQPELLALARGDRDSPLAAHLARATAAAARFGYADPLYSGRTDTPDAELDAALELRGGPDWLEFAVDVLRIAAPGS